MMGMQILSVPRFYPSLIVMLTLSFALLQLGCDSPNPPEKLDGAVLDAEVARRVAQIELEQRLDDLERKLEQQALTVEEKNRLIEDQRILLTEKSRADAGQLTSDPLLPPVEKSVPTQDLTQEPTRKPVQQITRTTTTDVGVNAGADYAMFYEKLEPHGTWIETPQYGAIWQPAPRYTPVGWQPYTRGSWTYADVGWTWVSTEPFGWATYHYGRWNNVSNRGWCWIPGNQWAPAWVSWRTGSNYVGWAPLPAQSRFLGNRISVQFGNDFDSGPGNYCFVPSRFFGSSSVYRHVVPNARNTVIIADTVNVTNIVRADDIVINQGPDYTELNRVAASPIRTARLIRNTQVPQGNASGVTWSGNNLNVAAPVIKAANPAQRTALQRADRITRLESVNGWEQVKSPVERQRLREQLARQNQRTQAREQAIAAAPSATQPPVAAKENPIEQRAQQEAQARRIAAQAERERLIAASRQDVAATPANPAVRPVPQIPQTQALREAALRREQAQKERERLANVAAARQQATLARQQATIANQQAQQQPQLQQQVVAPRPTAIVAPPKVSPASTQASREAQARRDQAQREREQMARAEAARQQVAINQRQAAQAARQTAPSRPVNQLQQRPQQVAQRPPAQQQQRPSAPAQPSAAQVQAARQAQARREAAQAERERSARQEALSQQRAQAQRQQLAAQRQNQPVRQQQITPAQQQRIDAAQRQRQQQMQRQQQPN
jgi:hypothetical protein